MVTRNNSRALLKKLSALRAILSDAEQNLLDTLLLSSCDNTSFSSAGEATGHDDPMAAADRTGELSSDGKGRPTIRIGFDKEKDMYVIDDSRTSGSPLKAGC